jgi:hypothetical protein
MRIAETQRCRVTCQLLRQVGADTAVLSTTAFGAAHSAAPCSGLVSSSALLTVFSGCAGCLLMLTA